MGFSDIGLAHGPMEYTKNYLKSLRRRYNTQRRWFVLFLALVLHENRVIYSCSEWVTNLPFRKYLIYCYAKSIFCFNRKKTFEKRFIILQKKPFFSFKSSSEFQRADEWFLNRPIARHQRTGPFRRSRQEHVRSRVLRLKELYFDVLNCGLSKQFNSVKVNVNLVK